MKDSKLVKVTSAGSTIEAQQITQILQEHGIRACRQGGIMDVYMGNSITGDDILVAETDFAAAQKILAEIPVVSTEQFQPARKFSKRQTIGSLILLFLILLILIIPLFFL